MIHKTITERIEAGSDGRETVEAEIKTEPEKGILRTENLVKRYGTRTVANHASINVTQGEIVGLLGLTASAKTTTFYMTTGLITPNEGKIFLDEQDITGFPVYKRAKLGIGYSSRRKPPYSANSAWRTTSGPCWK